MHERAERDALAFEMPVVVSAIPGRIPVHQTDVVRVDEVATGPRPTARGEACIGQHRTSTFGDKLDGAFRQRICGGESWGRCSMRRGPTRPFKPLYRVLELWRIVGIHHANALIGANELGHAVHRFGTRFGLHGIATDVPRVHIAQN